MHACILLIDCCNKQPVRLTWFHGSCPGSSCLCTVVPFMLVVFGSNILMLYTCVLKPSGPNQCIHVVRILVNIHII